MVPEIATRGLSSVSELELAHGVRKCLWIHPLHVKGGLVKVKDTDGGVLGADDEP